MTPPATQVLLVEDLDAVRVIRLNRPEKRNALNTELTTALRDALLDADRDENVRAVILTGEGQAFCAGADLTEFTDLTPENQEAVLARADLTTQTQMLLQELTKPVVSVVCGSAVGGGAGLAIGCDMMVASDDVRFGYPEMGHSLVPAIVMTGIQRQVGRKLAFELISLGRMLEGAELLAFGLANVVTSRAAAFETGHEIARSWAAAHPLAMAATKDLFYRVGDLPYRDAMQAGRDMNALMRRFPTA